MLRLRTSDPLPAQGFLTSCTPQLSCVGSGTLLLKSPTKRADEMGQKFKHLTVCGNYLIYSRLSRGYSINTHHQKADMSGLSQGIKTNSYFYENASKEH